MAYYRTRTYIAADWDGDKDLVDVLHRWNDNDYWNLSFSDAHDLMQARDTSLPCSIKKSLSERMSASKTFLLIVGANTNTVTKGECRYCSEYFPYLGRCRHGYGVDNRSYIKYECEKAVRDGLNIIVVYNYADVHRENALKLSETGVIISMVILKGLMAGAIGIILE